MKAGVSIVVRKVEQFGLDTVAREKEDDFLVRGALACRVRE